MKRKVIHVEKWQMVRVKFKLEELGYTASNYRHDALYHTDRDIWKTATITATRCKEGGRILELFEIPIWKLMMPKALELIADSRHGTYHWYLEGIQGTDIVEVVETILTEAG